MDIECFISIDWGTTNLRIRLIDVPTLAVLELIESTGGVKWLHDTWLDKGGNQMPVVAIMRNVSLEVIEEIL